MDATLTHVTDSIPELILGGLDGARRRQDALRIEMHKGDGSIVVGIGVALRRRARGGVGIESVRPDTPAARAGLLANEVIEAVDDVELSSRGKGVETAMALIRGQPDTSLRLRVRGTDGAVRTVNLDRGLIDVRNN